jgi:cysteine synthase A
MSILELIGNTPMVKLWSNVYAKLEMKNPSGSVKDRAAKLILENEKLPVGSHIVEATSGNFGISLAFASAVMGYKMTVVMPSSASPERKKIIEAYGGRVVTVDGSMTEAVKLARKISETDGAFLPNQFENKLNTLSHYKTTGPEILADRDSKVDIFVSGVGSGGTITGVARFLKEKNQNIKIVSVLPEKGSSIEGIGAGFLPPIYDESLVDENVFVTYDEAIEFARLLASEHGILSGASSGAAVCAAFRLSKRKENQGKNIVTILPDGGDRYYSTPLFVSKT